MDNPKDILAIIKRIGVAATIGIGPLAGFLDLVRWWSRAGPIARSRGPDLGTAFEAAVLWFIVCTPMIWLLYALIVYVLDPAGAKAAWSRPELPQADPVSPPPVAPPNRLHLFLAVSLIILIFGGLLGGLWWVDSHRIPAASHKPVLSLQELQAEQEAEIASGLRDPVTNRRLSSGRFKSREELDAEAEAEIASGLRDPVTNRWLSGGRLKSREELYAETMAHPDPNAPKTPPEAPKR